MGLIMFNTIPGLFTLRLAERVYEGNGNQTRLTAMTHLLDICTSLFAPLSARRRHQRRVTIYFNVKINPVIEEE